MSTLIFGIIWTAFSAVFAFLVFGIPGTMTVNGEVVSKDDYGVMLMPAIIIGIFIIIGIILIVTGLRKVLRDIATSKNGFETYGVVIGISETGTRVNERPELKAIVMVIMEYGEIQRFEEIIGFDYNRYFYGEYLKVKQYKKDINILDSIDSSMIPYNQLEKLENVKQQYVGNKGFMNYGIGNTSGVYDEYYRGENNEVKIMDDDTVIIDGVVYKKHEEN